MAEKRRKFEPEFREEAVRIVRETGSGGGVDRLVGVGEAPQRDRGQRLQVLHRPGLRRHQLKRRPPRPHTDGYVGEVLVAGPPFSQPGPAGRRLQVARIRVVPVRGELPVSGCLPRLPAQLDRITQVVAPLSTHPTPALGAAATDLAEPHAHHRQHRHPAHPPSPSGDSPEAYRSPSELRQVTGMTVRGLSSPVKCRSWWCTAAGPRRSRWRRSSGRHAPSGLAAGAENGCADPAVETGGFRVERDRVELVLRALQYVQPLARSAYSSCSSILRTSCGPADNSASVTAVITISAGAHRDPCACAGS